MILLRSSRVAARSRARLASALAAVATLGALLVAVPATSAVAAPIPASCPTSVTLTNGGFESPDIGGGFGYRNQGDVPGWSTTAPDGQIEIWHNPFGGFAPDSGQQFVELNANFVSTLFQDVATTPGQTLRWSLAHRGRSGVDVMAVKLGSPSGALVTQRNVIDGQTWATHSGLYVVPAGQTTTRFAFEAVSAAGGASQGNFLDSVVLGNAACVVSTKTVTDLSPATPVEVGDQLEYSITASNLGGTPATSASLTDALPPGVTFAPGSLVTSAPATDAAGDDSAEYGAMSVSARLGDGATASSGGSIPAGESRSFSFRVTVDATSNGAVLNNVAVVSYVDSLTGDPKSSITNETSTTVADVADLAVSQSLNDELVNGATVTYTITVSNNGADSSTDSTLTSQLPALDGLSIDNSACSITAGVLLCDFGTLAPGTITLTLTGTVPAGAGAGDTFVLSSVVDGSATDSSLANNTATTTGAVIAVSDLDLTVTLTPEVAGLIESGDSLLVVYEVTNTGNVVLYDVTVSSPIFGTVTCAAQLLPGETATCSPSETYTVTDDDAEAGSVSVTATAEGAPLDGSGIAIATAAASDSISVLALPVDTEDGDDVAGTIPGSLSVTGVDPSGLLVAASLILVTGVLLAASSVRKRPWPALARRRSRAA